MTFAYWDQFDRSEIMSMHAIEDDEYYYEELDYDNDTCNNNIDDADDASDMCIKCTGRGCNYCLMTDR